MNLNEITANIRLRNPWEAIDLGFSMVQKWWLSIYLPLALLTFGIASVLYLIFPKGNVWIASLIFWWLKPLYDRVILHILSHKLFNDELSTWQVLKALPSLIWNTGLFQSLTFRRFSLSRGFNLPIWQLEQLRGSRRSERQSVLHQIAHTYAAWLTIVMVNIEIVIVISLFGLFMLFLPEKTANDFFVGMFSNKVEYERWIDLLNYLFYVFAVTLIHPFYIGASFALYINRRTQLEAWDIELDFKKLALRFETLARNLIPALLCVFTLSLLSTSSPVAADEATNLDTTSETQVTEFLSDERLPAESSKQVIKETMLTKELNDKQTVTYWVRKDTAKKPKNDPDKFSFADFFEPFAKIMGFIIEFALWILVAIVLFLLFYFRDSWLHLFNIERKAKKESYQAPEVMFGMDVRPDSLPDDIISESRKLWDNKQHRESLSLLYRGALIRLINIEHVQLKDSFTEGDVLKHSQKKISEAKHLFLDNLTNNWKMIAYAHRHPTNEAMEQLFNTWVSDFAIENVLSDLESNTPKKDGSKDE
ncbi:DUF4129 domain-containing protein [Cocleimonas flava]|uniref:DUF4129 domain-containing protein n=1 Tax=Cocleimonas flava TaxID=634765 RepID=A0A4R1ETB6_9GAMM|nr:hypothetical protein [Cocleimonas flava]TCJ84443.1 hypothetical protein EV695_2400 [Cocleimonas flava]